MTHGMHSENVTSSKVGRENRKKIHTQEMRRRTIAEMQWKTAFDGLFAGQTKRTLKR